MSSSLGLSFVFCFSLRKVSFFFSAQAWTKWAEKRLNTNICKLSGFPEQSRSRWQSVGCSILVPVARRPLCSAAGYHRGVPGGHSGAGRQHPVLGDSGGRAPAGCAPAPGWRRQGIFGHKYQTARPEGNEDHGNADDTEPESEEDAMEVQKKTLLVSDGFFRGHLDGGSLAAMWGQCGCAASEAASALDSSSSSSGQESKAGVFLHNLLLTEKKKKVYHVLNLL